MSWLDIAVFVILIVTMIRGYIRGLILTLASMLSFIISILVAGLFYKDITQFIIDKTGLIDNISVFSNHNQMDLELISNSSGVHNFPQGAGEFIRNIMSNPDGFFSKNMDYGFPQIILEIVVFFVTVLLVRLFIHWIASIFNGVSKLPVLNFFNKTGGGILGIVEGCILNIVVVSLIYTIALFSSEGILSDTVNNSVVAQFFYLGYIIY